MKQIDQTKRIMIYISVLCAAIILMPVVVGADDIASATPVSIGDLNCLADGTITAPIMLSGIQNYGTGKINITYNPAMVHVTSVASSSDSTVITRNKNNSAGITSITAWNTDGVSGDIVFANITFTAVGTGSTSLNLDVSKLADTSMQLIPLTISNGSIGIESLQPSTPFLIHGYVSYENGSECNNPAVILTNLDMGSEWTAETIESSNYYYIMLGSADVITGEILQFNVVSPDGSQSVVTEHTVTQNEINDGGLFNNNITLVVLNQPPVADPNGPYTGVEGTEIAFDGSASSDPDGSIVSYDWDFGDGNTGTGVSPVHTYVQDDTYTVTLTVTDNAGVTASATTTATISDTEPVADFTATPSSGPEPLTVTFTDTSTSHDGITSWEWDFNNNGTVDSTEQNPANTYIGDGAYTVTLKVYETDGNSDTETKTDYITVSNVNQLPVSDPNGPYTGMEGTEIAFDGSGSSDPDGSIVSYDWDFGDGNTGTGVSPVHTYVQDGTYTVNLTVTDNAGVTNSATTTVTISDTGPVADFTATPSSGPEPLTVTFTDTSTSHDGITSWEWDFDNDGTVDSTEQNPANTYTGDGAYTVTLKVYETDGNSDTETKIDYITVSNVNQLPVSDPNGPYTGMEGTEVAFDGSGSSDPDGSIVSYNWDFGDGNTGTGVSPVHTYVQDDTYTVTLTVTDNAGVTNSATTTVTISDTGPVADFTATPSSGPEPLTVTFTDTSTSHDGITSWEWDFDNDGTVDSTEPNPANTYTGDGAYTVTLKVYETDGNSDTETKTDYITVTNVNQLPVSDPNGPYTGMEGTEIAFDGSASSDPDGSIVSYNWDFGDGNTGTGVSPVHTYVQDDTYTVTLTVTDNAGATDSDSTTATISDTEPVADFTATPSSGPEPLSVSFTDTSTSHDGITSWEWDFDNDGTVDSTEQNPANTYTGDGAYTVTLKVYETDGNSDTETKTDYITVTNVNQLPVSNPNGPYTGMEGTEIAFDGSASSDPDGSIVSYNWDFGDGNTGTGVSPVHTYVQDDTYTVTLTVTDNAGATDFGSTTATISDTEPVADFTATPSSGPEPLTVTFTDTSTSHDGITSWEWDFDNDGTVDSTEQNPANTYTGDGAYTVTLKVYETDGNSDTETKTDYITVSNVNQLPVSDPNGPYTGMEGTEVAFDGSGSSDPDGSIVSYNWDFGDGNTGTGVSPVHTYVQDDTYTVTLTVTDNAGATDSDSTTATISDTEPVADFTATPSSGPEPLTVTFTDTSTSHDGITSWEWDFDNDGTVDSTEPNPANTYTGDGAYTVTLKVYETDGNSDTETKIDYITVTDVNQLPVSDPNGPYTGMEGTEIAFDGSASSDPDGSIVSYDWDFGDGNTGTGVSPVHTYVQDDTYTVTLTVTDNAGATDSDSTTATISDTEPVADFTAIPSSGPEPLSVSFTDTSTSHDGITSWEWDFDNDGTVDSTEPNPANTYTGDGAYTVTLKVYETDGNSDTETKIDYITVTDVNQLPVSDPNGPYTGAEGTEVAFDGSGSYDPDGSIVTYDWDFGDGTSGTGVSPGHTYDQDGTYTVNLTVTDNAGETDSDSTTVVVGNLVDTIAPAVIIDQVTSPTNVSSQTISGTFTESGSGIDLITVNGINAEISGTIYSVTIGLTEGTNPVYVIAIDNAGNSGSNSTTIVLDTTAPAVSITKPKAKHNMIKFVNNIVRGTVDDDNLNYAILIVKNNNDIIVNSYNLNIKSNKFTQRVQFAPDQNNTLELFAIDNAGNFNNISRTVYVETNKWEDILTVKKNKPVKIDASNEIGTAIEFLSNVTVTNVTFRMTAKTNQTWVEGLNDSASFDDEIAVGKIVEINVTGDLDATNESQIQHVIVKLYYTMDDLDLDGDGTIEHGELDENNMFIYWHNTTSSNWTKLLKDNPDWVLDNGQVKISGNNPGYIWVKVRHLSTFGLVACPEPEFSGDGNDQEVLYDSGSSVGISRGSSGEACDNIALKEFIRKYIGVDTTVKYQFEEDENGIEYITFDAKTNAEYVEATIEILEDTSALVSSAPSGKVYQHMNVLVGSSGYATERNIADPVIGFKVARSWIAANNIDESKIRLNRYSDENWNPLATSLINEDADYLHFESVTPGFSPFAITAEAKKAETDGEGIVAEPAAGVEAAEATPEQVLPDEMSEIPGFGLLSGLSVVLVAMQILRKQR